MSKRETPAEEIERATGAQGPQGWRLYGIVALVVVALLLLAGQLLSGNKGTAVYSGSPVAAPQTENPSLPPPSNATN